VIAEIVFWAQNYQNCAQVCSRPCWISLQCFRRPAQL